MIWPVRGRPESVDYIRDKRGYKRAPLFHCLKFRYTSAPFYFRTIAQLRGKREEKKKKLLQTVNKIPRTNRQSGFKCTMGRRPLTFLTNNSSVLPFQGFCYRKKEWRLNCFHRKMRRFPLFLQVPWLNTWEHILRLFEMGVGNGFLVLQFCLIKVFSNPAICVVLYLPMFTKLLILNQ